MLGAIAVQHFEPRALAFVSDGRNDSEAKARHDCNAVRPRPGLEYGNRFETTRVEPRQACRSTIGDKDRAITGNDARGLWKIGQCRDVLAGVVIDHLDPVATGMRGKNASGRRIESAVIEGAASGVRYPDHADVFQRHDRLAVAREQHRHSSGAAGVSGRAYDGRESFIPSMRNHLDNTSVAQSLDGTV
jgi:hypothetical protein